jgi:hypothetical protein
MMLIFIDVMNSSSETLKGSVFLGAIYAGYGVRDSHLNCIRL